MVYEEVKFWGDMHQFRLNEPVEGILEEVRENVGKNQSNVYKVNGIRFWGTTSIDQGLDQAKIGQKVKLTLINEAYVFPGTGRVGRLFKVEIDR